MDPLLHTLNNNISLVHQRISGSVAHCGLIINTGSRDETEAEHGIAHFIEHMLFKGTRKRKAYHILSRLEDVGGELNAYTTKEETAIYASFLREDYERAAELIYDITFNSVFPDKEIIKEKEVVIEEINSYLDNPAELIFDDFEEMVFPDQPIGRNTLGTPASVRSFSQEMISSFITRNYSSSRIVFCSAGDIDNKEILRIFNKNFNNINGRKNEPADGNEGIYKSQSLTRSMNTFQNHCIIGNVAFDLKDKRRPGMSLLNNILGGQGLNSRLNLSLREKNGLAYNIESSYNPYQNTGIFSIYFGTDKDNLQKSISLVMKELTKLRTSRLGEMQLAKARRQMKGYLIRSYENHETLMLGMGKSLLLLNRAETISEICRQIDDVTSSEILETANTVFDPSQLSVLIYE